MPTDDRSRRKTILPGDPHAGDVDLDVVTALHHCSADVGDVTRDACHKRWRRVLEDVGDPHSQPPGRDSRPARSALANNVGPLSKSIERAHFKACMPISTRFASFAYSCSTASTQAHRSSGSRRLAHGSAAASRAPPLAPTSTG